MKSKNIKKGCGITSIILILFIVGLFWMFKQAFGPTYKTVEIEKPLGKLICKEKYTADMADVSYDIDFKLIDKNLDTIYLGNGIYNDDDWSKKIELIKINDWYGIITNYYSHAKIGVAKKQNNERLNIVFNPLELKNDSIWKKTNEENPAWVYEGSSKIKSIEGNQIKVEYKYRLGLYEPFVFKKQDVEYYFDSNLGKLLTENVRQATDGK